MDSVSAVIITRNEARRIETCLRSLSWADEIIVVDSESQDETVEIASRFTGKIYRRPFDHFANQKNYGLDLATGEWILSIDADEVVSPELQRSLAEISKNGSKLDGFCLDRVNYLFGKRLRFGGQGSDKVLRFFRKGKARFEQPIHEKVVVNGLVSEISGDLLHYSTSSVSDYLKKLNLYTEFEAGWMEKQGAKPGPFALYLKPPLRFFYNYVLRLGFLDGFEGFLYHTLSSYYDFLKYARLVEILSEKGN